MKPKMKAALFVEPGRIVLDDKPIPQPGPLDALIRVTTTTICGTDVHILKGEYPVAKGLTIGHEPVGVIEKLGSAVQGYEEGQRVIAGAITPSGHSYACLCGNHSQDGAGTRHGFKPAGGWRFGNTIDGCQAEYVLVPDAMANLSPVPEGLTDEEVLMCPDIMSTGFSGAESAGSALATSSRSSRSDRSACVRSRAQSSWAPPPSLASIPCRSGWPWRSGLAQTSCSISRRAARSSRSCRRPTAAASMPRSKRWAPRGPLKSALRVLRPGGTLSSLGVYSTDLTIPLSAFTAGLGDNRIVTTLCPGGKERMRRLMTVVASGRVDLKPLVTHRFRLDDIEDAYELFSHQLDGVLKVAITP